MLDNGQQKPARQGGSRARGNTPLVIVLAVVVVVCLIGGIAGGAYLINTYAQIRDVENSQSLQPILPEEMSDHQANPIDFDALSEQNVDIYAWIYLPGTNINYPVCQSDVDDAYYLTHNALKQETELGAIFSEHRFNSCDMRDRVTILYGHNGYGDTMFTPLHQFEYADFFNKHDKLYLYVPGYVYTYKIVSAYMAGDDHLMGMYNFQSDADFERFLGDISNPSAIGANTREVATGLDSKVLVLSTCNTGALDSTGRYLVCGVMVDVREFD